MDKGMVNTSFVLIGVAFLLIIIACVIIVIVDERRAFNGGICQHCGAKLRHFDNDSQGGRGYCCDKCGHHIWISWRFVDKGYVGPVPTEESLAMDYDGDDPKTNMSFQTATDGVLPEENVVVTDPKTEIHETFDDRGMPDRGDEDLFADNDDDDLEDLD